MRKFIDAFCQKHGVEGSKGKAFKEALYESIFSDKKVREEMYENVYMGAQRLWTSALVFKASGP